jgi:hypothetical protein
MDPKQPYAQPTGMSPCAATVILERGRQARRDGLPNNPRQANESITSWTWWSMGWEEEDEAIRRAQRAEE